MQATLLEKHIESDKECASGLGRKAGQLHLISRQIRGGQAKSFDATGAEERRKGRHGSRREA